MSVSLKINRLELVEKLKAARQAKNDNYEKALAKYNEELETKTALALKELQKQLDKGKVKFNYSGVEVSTTKVKLNNSKPSKPSSHDLERLDNQIRNLSLAVNDTITISDKSDYFRYL
jgi:hypothetical protein